MGLARRQEVPAEGFDAPNSRERRSFVIGEAFGQPVPGPEPQDASEGGMVQIGFHDENGVFPSFCQDGG